MKPIWFESQLENEIVKAIGGCYPGSWIENDISDKLLETLKDFCNSHSYYDRLTGLSNIEFAYYKLSGKPETEYGDIALLTTIRFDNDRKLRGVAYFEAKKRLKNEFRYQKQSSNNQYKTICKNAPYSQLLLYDFEPITQHIKPTLDFEYLTRYQHIHPNNFLFTKCAVLPLYLTEGEKEINRNFIRHSRTLTEQLCRRIFYGIDLHYSEQAIKSILSFDKTHHPKFVATLEITHGNTTITDDADRFDIPRQLYRLME